MPKAYSVDKLTCSKYDPETGDEHAPAQWLMRWQKEPFQNYPWAFCTPCKDTILEAGNAEIITEL